MNAKNAIDAVINRTTYHIGLWALLALLLLAACSPGAGATPEPQDPDLPQKTEPKQPVQSTPAPTPAQRDSGQKSGQSGLGQVEPPKQELDVVQVDLNAIEPDPKVFEAAQLCPGLAGPLPLVISDTHPVAKAEALGLQVREGQVQVTLVLDSSDAAFLRQVDVEVGKQLGNEVQAYVPISLLCELVKHERVQAIYPVSVGEAQ